LKYQNFQVHQFIAFLPQISAQVHLLKFELRIRSSIVATYQLSTSLAALASASPITSILPKEIYLDRTKFPKPIHSFASWKAYPISWSMKTPLHHSYPRHRLQAPIQIVQMV
jgi:hypothetical protein